MRENYFKKVFDTAYPHRRKIFFALFLVSLALSVMNHIITRSAFSPVTHLMYIENFKATQSLFSVVMLYALVFKIIQQVVFSVLIILVLRMVRSGKFVLKDFWSIFKPIAFNLIIINIIYGILLWLIEYTLGGFMLDMLLKIGVNLFFVFSGFIIYDNPQLSFDQVLKKNYEMIKNCWSKLLLTDLYYALAIIVFGLLTMIIAILLGPLSLIVVFLNTLLMSMISVYSFTNQTIFYQEILENSPNSITHPDIAVAEVFKDAVSQFPTDLIGFLYL